MGAWGAGSFENDDALDFLAGLKAHAGWEPVRRALDAIDPSADEIDASEGAVALAAAELVAASRGHPPADLPPDGARFAATAGPADENLVGAASLAVLTVSGDASELKELWADSDDPAVWNQAVGDLIERVGRGLGKPLEPPAESETTAMVCSFCLETIAEKHLVVLTLSRPSDPPEIEQRIFAHEKCLESKMHPLRGN